MRTESAKRGTFFTGFQAPVYSCNYVCLYASVLKLVLFSPFIAAFTDRFTLVKYVMIMIIIIIFIAVITVIYMLLFKE